jgi:hypothetical protein
MKKKECARIRKSLAKYLSGHLFKLEQVRIERHLRSCVVCYSQYQALKRADETRQFLKDITPPEGMVQRMREGVSGLARTKKLLYRPLWIAAIVAVAAGSYYYLGVSQRPDVELESIIRTAPSGTAPAAPALPETPARPAAVTAPTMIAQPAAPRPVGARVVEPLAVSFTTENEKAAVRRVNEIMRGHGQLRTMKFSDTVREISGSLTAKELLTFFNRIELVGKISYSRRRFEAFPSAQPIPFVMKLTVAPGAKAPSVQPAQKPPEQTAPALPVTMPTPSAAPKAAN